MKKKVQWTKKKKKRVFYRHRDAKKMTDEQFKNLHALKVKDQKGEIIKCTKETISILIHDSYHVNVERQIVQGPDPIVLRYIVDEDLRVCIAEPL